MFEGVRKRKGKMLIFCIVLQAFPFILCDVMRTSVKVRVERDALEVNIPGTPGVDYTTFNDVPETSFSCKSHAFPGYYADVSVGCQVFHVCQKDGKQSSFLCPNGTVLNQQYFVCDWWYNFNCATAEQFYDLNANLYKNRGPNLQDGLEQILDPSFLRSATQRTLTQPPAADIPTASSVGGDSHLDNGIQPLEKTAVLSNVETKTAASFRLHEPIVTSPRSSLSGTVTTAAPPPPPTPSVSIRTSSTAKPHQFRDTGGSAYVLEFDEGSDDGFSRTSVPPSSSTLAPPPPPPPTITTFQTPTPYVTSTIPPSTLPPTRVTLTSEPSKPPIVTHLTSQPRDQTSVTVTETPQFSSTPFVDVEQSLGYDLGGGGGGGGVSTSSPHPHPETLDIDVRARLPQTQTVSTLPAAQVTRSEPTQQTLTPTGYHLDVTSRSTTVPPVGTSPIITIAPSSHGFQPLRFSQPDLGPQELDFDHQQHQIRGNIQQQLQLQRPLTFEDHPKPQLVVGKPLTEGQTQRPPAPAFNMPSHVQEQEQLQQQRPQNVHGNDNFLKQINGNDQQSRFNGEKHTFNIQQQQQQQQQQKHFNEQSNFINQNQNFHQQEFVKQQHHHEQQQNGHHHREQQQQQQQHQQEFQHQQQQQQQHFHHEHHQEQDFRQQQQKQLQFQQQQQQQQQQHPQEQHRQPQEQQRQQQQQQPQQQLRQPQEQQRQPQQQLQHHHDQHDQPQFFNLRPESERQSLPNKFNFPMPLPPLSSSSPLHEEGFSGQNFQRNPQTFDQHHPKDEKSAFRPQQQQQQQLQHQDNQRPQFNEQPPPFFSQHGQGFNLQEPQRFHQNLQRPSLEREQPRPFPPPQHQQQQMLAQTSRPQLLNQIDEDLPPRGGNFGESSSSRPVPEMTTFRPHVTSPTGPPPQQQEGNRHPNIVSTLSPVTKMQEFIKVSTPTSPNLRETKLTQRPQPPPPPQQLSLSGRHQGNFKGNFVETQARKPSRPLNFGDSLQQQKPPTDFSRLPPRTSEPVVVSQRPQKEMTVISNLPVSTQANFSPFRFSAPPQRDFLKISQPISPKPLKELVQPMTTTTSPSIFVSSPIPNREMIQIGRNPSKGNNNQQFIQSTAISPPPTRLENFHGPVIEPQRLTSNFLQQRPFNHHGERLNFGMRPVDSLRSVMEQPPKHLSVSQHLSQPLPPPPQQQQRPQHHHQQPLQQGPPPQQQHKQPLQQERPPQQQLQPQQQHNEPSPQQQQQLRQNFNGPSQQEPPPRPVFNGPQSSTPPQPHPPNQIIHPEKSQQQFFPSSSPRPHFDHNSQQQQNFQHPQEQQQQKQQQKQQQQQQQNFQHPQQQIFQHPQEQQQKQQQQQQQQQNFQHPQKQQPEQQKQQKPSFIQNVQGPPQQLQPPRAQNGHQNFQQFQMPPIFIPPGQHKQFKAIQQLQHPVFGPSKPVEGANPSTFVFIPSTTPPPMNHMPPIFIPSNGNINLNNAAFHQQQHQFPLVFIPQSKPNPMNHHQMPQHQSISAMSIQSNHVPRNQFGLNNHNNIQQQQQQQRPHQEQKPNHGPPRRPHEHDDHDDDDDHHHHDDDDHHHRNHHNEESFLGHGIRHNPMPFQNFIGDDFNYGVERLVAYRGGGGSDELSSKDYSNYVPMQKDVAVLRYK